MSEKATKEPINQKLSARRALCAENIKLMKLKINFDIQTLNMIIAFLLKDSVLRTRKTIQNIQKLFDNMDETMYKGNLDMEVRIWTITQIIRCLLKEQFEDTTYIKVYCKDFAEDDYTRDFIDTIDQYQIKYNESKYLVKKIDSALEYGYIVTVRDVMMQLLEQIDTSDFLTYAAVSEDLYQIAMAIVNIKRQSRSLNAEQSFSLENEKFEEVITDAVNKLKDRNRIFITGIQYLNTILSPGYLSKRLYMYLALPGRGKSQILLKSALDIRKYNGNIKTKNPEKRPAVLFLTLENDIAETVERMFNMSVGNEDIRNYKPSQVIKMMRDDGLKLTDESPIDIVIKEYKNRELSTDDLYTIINDMSDQGIEVVALIIDYVKRIRPAEYADTEKAELKNISNELKELAKFYDIPVITAQQINRNGASVVDAAIQNNVEDVTRLVGRDAIAGAWELQENSDVVIIVNPQVQKNTNKLFMAFKLLKRRYRSSEIEEHLRRLEYFNQPFEEGNEIRLVDDIDMDEPAGKTSLSTEYESEDKIRREKGNDPYGKRGGWEPRATVQKENVPFAYADRFDEFSTDTFDYRKPKA